MTYNYSDYFRKLKDCSKSLQGKSLRKSLVGNDLRHSKSIHKNLKITVSRSGVMTYGQI